MNRLPVAQTSDWNEDQINDFLTSANIPIRLACIDKKGYPLVCSLWFCFLDGYLWCASHRKSHIVKLLQENNRCGFEIGVNDQPYMGVRGQGRVDLLSEKAGEILSRLVTRYEIAEESSLARWLLSRTDDEYAVRISITRITSWDYSDRMS
jgi:nitroimidazol reductase NimA-like FMN-containing flavoprotein (pyridoxamine 5'-phosphate oxidase superfamily)